MSGPSSVSRRAVSTTQRRRASPGELAAGRRIEAQRLQEQGEVLGPAAGRDVRDEAFLVGGVGRIRVVVDEQLRGRGTEPLGLLDRPAGQDPRHARSGVALVPRRLDRHQQAGTARQGPVGDALGGADLGIEQRARGIWREGADDGPLERDHLVVRGRGGRLGMELLAQVLAMVEREHRERAAGRGTGVEAPSTAKPELGPIG